MFSLLCWTFELQIQTIMKTIRRIAIVCCIFLGVDMFAQTSLEEAGVIPPCETTFITLGTGLNSNYGIIGVGVDFKLLEKLQGAVSGGLGSWGFKSAGEVRYFYSGCVQKGSAVAVGVAYASGLPEMETELELASEETKNVTLELLRKPIFNCLGTSRMRLKSTIASFSRWGTHSRLPASTTR
jgi:hypothetical protein